MTEHDVQNGLHFAEGSTLMAEVEDEGIRPVSVYVRATRSEPA